MARIVDYQPLDSGGYLAIGDDGQTTPTAYLPPSLKMSIDAQKQAGMAAPMAQLNPSIAEAAMAPQPDQRLASTDLGTLPDQTITGTPPNALDTGLQKAGRFLGDAWNSVKASGAEIRAREAARGNFSGIHNTDVQAAQDAGVALPGPTYGGNGAPMSAPGGAEAGGNIVPPDQRVQVGGGQRPQAFNFGGGGTQVIRGGERKAGEVMGSTSYDPDAQANLKRGYQNQYEATQKAGEAQKVENEGTANLMTQIPAGLNQLEADRQDAEANRQASIAGDIDKLNQLRQESRQDIDPGRIWHDESQGSKFWGALMVGLGTLGSGMSGQPNVALSTMNKAIDNDIDAQKENRNNKRAQFEDQRSLYKDNLARFQDERQAEVATKAAYLEHAQAQLAALKAQAKTPEDEAKIDLLSADIQKEAAKTALEFTKITHQIHTVVVPDRVVGGGGPKLENLNRSLVVQDLQGNKYLARDEKRAGELTTKHALAQGAIRAADTMRKIANTPGFDKLDPTSPLVGEFNYAREQFVNSSNSLMGQGVTKDEDIKRYNSDIVKGPYGLATAKVAQALAGKIHVGYQDNLEAGADTDTKVQEAPEYDAKTGTIRKGVHYDQGELLGGGRQSGGSVNFTPAWGGK